MTKQSSGSAKPRLNGQGRTATITYTQRDFSEFAKALSAGFKPNRALNSASTEAAEGRSARLTLLEASDEPQSSQK